ncbi:MAG: hypothetical protein Q4D65_04770 [Peptostreptococcaceae bacterium]|nr:hypothetical protein [Peptostreptococcaceae bacterium]
MIKNKTLIPEFWIYNLDLNSVPMERRNGGVTVPYKVEIKVSIFKKFQVVPCMG